MQLGKTETGFQHKPGKKRRILSIGKFNTRTEQNAEMTKAKKISLQAKVERSRTSD